MSVVAFSKRTLSGSAEVPATGASFFLPKQPARSVAPMATKPIVLPSFRFILVSNPLCESPFRRVLHCTDGLRGVGRMEDRASRNQNFSAGSNEIDNVFGTHPPTDFDPEGIIIALSNSFQLPNLPECPRNKFLAAEARIHGHHENVIQLIQNL